MALRWQAGAAADQVQRAVPESTAAPLVVPLALEALAPVMHLAHRVAGTLRIAPRVIVDHELVLIVSGTGTLQLGEHQHDWSAGDLFCIQPFVPHEFRGASACEHVAVHFDPAPDVPTLPADLRERPPYRVVFSEGRGLPERTRLHAGDALWRGMDQILAAWESRSALGKVQAQAHLALLLATLLLAPGPHTPMVDAAHQARLERALRLVRTQFARRLANHELAAASGLSKAHFNRLFTQWTGYPPMEYLRRYRVARARELLARVDLSIKEVAHASGFEDQASFSKTFRQVEGLAPTEYRNAALAGR